MLGNDGNQENTDTTSHGQSQRHDGAWRALFALTVALSLVVLFAPHADVPSAPAGVDKVVHCLLFAALALTGALARVPLAGLIVGLLVYAGASEVIQGLPVLGRDSSPFDALADAVGVAVGLGLWRIVRKKV